MVNYDELIKNINILLADDDEDYLLMTGAFLKQKGYNIDKANNGVEALEKLKTGKYQIALLDYYMPGFNGEEVIEEIRKENKEIVIVLQTGFSGQKPPIETLKKLGIQNYFDKTEGIEKLHIELISAVKVFGQQNEIKVEKFKSNIIGKLMAGIAQKIKCDLMNISAGNEVTHMMLTDKTTTVEAESLQKLEEIYDNNRSLLDKIDRALSSIISQDTMSKDFIMTDSDIIDMINIILENDSKIRSIDFKINLSLKTKSYISGNINNTLYVVCEIIKNLMWIDSGDNKIELALTEDENNWIFDISSSRISNFSNTDIYVYENVIVSLENEFVINQERNKIDIFIKKDNII